MSKRRRRRKGRHSAALASAGAASVHRRDRPRGHVVDSTAVAVSPSSGFDGPVAGPVALAFGSLAVVIVPVLLGAAAAMVLAGVDLMFRDFAGNASVAMRLTTPSVAGAVLVALAVGVRVPQRVAWWIGAQAWQRFVRRGRPSSMSDVWTRSTRPDRPLYWIVLSLLALGAGLLSSLMPTLMGGMETGHAWLYEHFVWSTGPQAVLHAGMVFAVVLLPMAVLGLAIASAHHLSCDYGRWDTRATGWVLVGAAFGGAASSGIVQSTGRHDMILVVAALPVLMVSLIAGLMGSSRGTSFEQGEVDDGALLPYWTDRWPALIRAAIVAVGGVGAFVLAVWIGHRSTSGAPVGLFVPTVLAAGGLGVLAGCRRSVAGRRSIGGFGVRCAVTGGVLAAGVLTAGADAASGALITASLGMLAIGYTTAYGRQALLNRVADRSSTGATMLARVLVCAGLVVWVGAPLAEYRLGMPSSMAVAGLLLFAVGGVLIIYEPAYSPRMRQLRLGLVFGAIGMMMALVM